MRRLVGLCACLGLVCLGATPAWAGQGQGVSGLDTVWVLVAAYLVFFMQAGFAMVETGLTRAKNAVNILAKNLMDFAVATIIFYLVGYGLMFGAGNSFVGTSGWALEGFKDTNLPVLAAWFFQAVFCGTAATIVSGAMAERTRFGAYLVATAVLSGLVYPVIGHWSWGGGWLSRLGFFDFAGSSVVHSTGGWAGLVGAAMLGPRIGKYSPDGSPRVVAGHNLPLAVLGVFILWFGWFGFNPGSQLAASGADNARALALITVNTNLAAAAGALVAIGLAWAWFGKPDVSMAMNGALGGLVGITAPCAVVSMPAAIVIGAIAGAVVVCGVRMLDRIGVDDPVGAVSVHGLCGTWGTLAVGIWGQKALGLARDGLLHGGGLAQLGVQALGAAAIAGFSVACMLVVFWVLKHTMGLRVGRAEELRGLDIDEHGMEAYADFQIFTTT